MEAARSSETSVPIFQSKLRNIPEKMNVYQHRYKNLKSGVSETTESAFAWKDWGNPRKYLVGMISPLRFRAGTSDYVTHCYRYRPLKASSVTEIKI